MSKLIDSIRWEAFPIAASAAVGQVNLSIGQVGDSGPIGVITAGIHGDEGPWGAWAIHKLLQNTDISDLKGTLRVVPAANPLAMEADSRNAPLDALDLNRTFPGNAEGSHTERLAAALVARALPGADIVIDLHGGGSWCVNAFAFQFPGSEELSRAFDAPFLLIAPDRSVTLTGYARSLGAKVAAVEMGGRSEIEESWAERIARGLRRALGIGGVLSPSDSDLSNNVAFEVGATTVLRPSQGGIFIPQVRTTDVGTIIPGGTTLGCLLDPATYNIIETFVAPFERTALLLLRPTVAQLGGGAMTYVVAEPLLK